MKERNRIFAILLAVMMVFTYMPGLAYAAAGDETEPAVTTDSQEEPAMEEAVQTESAESDEPVDADVPSEAAETEVRSDEAALPEEDAEEVSPENTDASDKTEAPKEAVVKTLKKDPVNVKPKVKLDDSDELLMAYLENAVAEEVNDAAPAGNGKEATNSRSRINTLENDAEYALYEMLESYISYVASGEKSSTEFTVSMSSLFGDKLSYTEEELGTPIIVDEQISDAAIEAFDAMFECDVERVVNALMADMPFELYWYDKTEGYLYGFDSDYTTDGESLSFDSEDPGFVVSFYVSPDYSADGSRKTMEVNTEKTSAAASFVSNTVDIINGHSADSDVEKLYAYKEAVCKATDYNDAAAASTWTKGYGDPWQLIYVFDGDTSTKVVCEGYSKAFQFLCDRTEFNNTGIEAYSVTGNMDGGTGAGAHMWNILHMDDGNNYIADVTNCDEGNIGAPDDLFLKGCAEGSVDGGYSYTCGVDYTYDTDTRNTYSDEELVMSASDYVEGSGDNPDDPDDPTEEISSISYTTADGKGTVDNPIVLTEGIDGQDEYNGDQETYFNYEYYCNEGDLLTINYGSDGEESVTYHYEDGDFVDEDNNYSDYNPSFSFGDQEESPFEPGKTYSAVMSYGDQQTCNVYFRIVESPIASVSFIDADGKGTADDPIVLTEGLDGEYDEDVFYYEYYFNDGDALTVTYTDADRGTVTYYYDSDRERFISSAGEKLSYTYDGPRFRSTQSFDPWETGKDYSADISLGGRSAKTHFSTAENPYASVAYTDAKGRGASADNPIPVIEGLYGYYRNNEDTPWFYYFTDFNQGDILIVNFKDETKDPVTYYYDRYEEGFYNSEGEYLAPWPGLYNNQDITHWEKGNVYEATLDFANIETTIYYKVIENPVKEVSFSREGGVQITEGADGVNSDGGDGTFFEYYFDFEEGDVITAKIQEEGKEPVDVNYVGVIESDDEDEYLKFVNESDEKDYFYANEISWNSDEQSAGTEWKYNDGKDHWFTIEYMGVESGQIPVTMLQNPVSSFTFERDGGVNLMDGVDGVNSDGGDEEFFEYRLEFKPGDQIIVTKPTGGMNRYEAVPRDEDSTEVSKFVLKTSEGFVEEEFIDANRIQITDQPPQWDTHWGLEDGIKHSFVMQYSGRTYEVPVTLVANPVEGISFSREGYDEEHPIELMDQVDGWQSDDNPEVFQYDLRFKEGDILTVTWKGNDYSYVYTYSQGDEDDAFVLNGEYSNKPKDLPERLTGNEVMTESVRQFVDEPWGLNEEHVFNVTYNGRGCPVNVITVGNPIGGISFSREGYDEEHPIELMYKVDGWYNKEENRFFYGLWFNEGDELTVTVGENDYIYIYTAAEQGDEEDSFVLKDGYSNVPDVLPQKIADSDVWIEDDQYDNPWKTDEDHIVGITYKGRSYSVNVHTTENPVEGISFARYDDEGHVISPIELMDQVDGWYEDDDPDRFWYALWFSEGDELTVTWRGKDYTYIFTHFEQADEEDAFVLKSGYTNVPEDLPQKITDDVWTDSDQEETEWSVGDTNREFNIRYMGYACSVPVKIVANSGKIDINKCEVSFNEDYLVNEDIASTEYTDWFFVFPAGEEFEPIVKDGDKILGPESYTVRYREQEFDVTADDGDGAWGPMEGAEWLNTFPTETGVYFVEVYGAGEYAGKYNGMFPLIRIGDHSWSEWTVTKEANCTTKGEKERTCSHCKVRYTEEIAVDSDAHDWCEPSYAWADDNSTCSASRMCGNNPTHIEMETANAEYTVIKEATETEDGEGQWTATFKNEAFETQTKTEIIPYGEHQHSWGDGVVTVDPTTLSEGVRTYTCSCGETRTEVIDKLEASDSIRGLAELPDSSEIRTIGMDDKIDITDLMDGKVHTFCYVSDDSELMTDIYLFDVYDGNQGNAYLPEVKIFDSDDTLYTKEAEYPCYPTESCYAKGKEIYIQFKGTPDPDYGIDRPYYITVNVHDYSFAELPDDPEVLAENDVKVHNGLAKGEVITYKINPSSYDLSLILTSSDDTECMHFTVFDPGREELCNGYPRGNEPYQTRIHAYDRPVYLQLFRGMFDEGAETADVTIELKQYKEPTWAPIDPDCQELELFKTSPVTIDQAGSYATVKFTADEDGEYVIRSTDAARSIFASINLQDEFLEEATDSYGYDFIMTYNCTAGTTYYIQTRFSSKTYTGTFGLLVERTHTHDMVYTPAVSPTEDKDGNIAYYTCNVCHKHFKNKSGTTVVTDEEIVIPALGPATPMGNPIALTPNKTTTTTFKTSEGGYRDFTLSPTADGVYAVNVSMWERTGEMNPEDAVTCSMTDSDGNAVQALAGEFSTSGLSMAHLFYLQGGKTYTLRYAATLPARINGFESDEMQVFVRSSSTSGSLDIRSYEVNRVSAIIKFNASSNDTYTITRADNAPNTKSDIMMHLISGDGSQVLKSEQNTFSVDLTAGTYYLAVVERGEDTSTVISIKGTKCEHVAGAAVHENEVAATCGTPGHYDEVVYCSKCGAEMSRETKTIPATGKHTEEVIPAVAATCTETGLTAGKKCSVCGEILVAQTETPAKGHTWGKATYTWADDFTSVTGTHSCTVCGDSFSAVAPTAKSEVTKAPTTTEKGEITYTSEEFAEGGFEVQTIKVDIEPLTVDEAISQAADQTEDADGKASAVENSTNEGAISDAENSATQAAAMAAMAEEAAQTAYDSAKSVYDNLPADASEADKQTALANYENAVTNLAVAKQLKAAASSAVAKSKKAAAKVAANKAAAAYNSANSAASSAAAEVFRKEAEAQAAIAAEKAGAADNASADAAKAVSDLGKLAEEIADVPVANTVEEAVEAAKTEANTSAGTASEASTAADTSSGNAKTSADKAKEAVNNKAKAEADAAKKAAEAAKPATKPEVVDLKAVKSLKLKAAKGKITVKWKKATKKELKTFQSYEIQYTLDGTFKDYQPKTVGKKKATVTLKKLLKKKKYTVRIRRVRDDGSVLHVSPWKQKKAKTK